MQTGMASVLHFWPASYPCFLSTCINFGSFAQVFMHNKINTISQCNFCPRLSWIINKYFIFISLYMFYMQNRYKNQESCQRSHCSRSFGFQTLKLASLRKVLCLPVEGRRKWKQPCGKRREEYFSFLGGLYSLRAQQKSVLHTEYAIDYFFSVANSVVIT